MKKTTAKEKHINPTSMRKNLILICLNYGFIGINFIISCFFKGNPNYKISIMLGIVMLFMVPISCLHKRESMRGKFNVVGTCIMHLVSILSLSWFYSSWQMVILGVFEIVVSIIVQRRS